MTTAQTPWKAHRLPGSPGLNGHAGALERKERSDAAPPADDLQREASAPFALVQLADLDNARPDPPGYIWQNLVPCGHVTLFSGHGGAGKSTIALELAIAVAAGLPLFGLPTTQAPVVMFSAEDSAHLIRHRVDLVCRRMGVKVAALLDKLFILDATDHDPILFTEVNVGGRCSGVTTGVYEQLRDFVLMRDAGLLLVDNASDVYDVSEINRARVRQFMRALTMIGREADAGVVLLAHVDKGTSRGERSGTESYSGTTAWHNSARSRLFLSRTKEDGGLVLEQQKNNLGPLHPPIELCWPPGGVPELNRALGPVVQGMADRNHERALLKLIAEFSARNEHVGAATTSRTHAGKLLRREPGFPAVKNDAEVFDVLRKSERAGRLVRATVKTESRKDKEVWQITPAGLDFLGIAPTAPTAPGSESAQ